MELFSPPSGFDVSNAKRNEHILAASGDARTLQSRFLKTGTTIVGVTFRDGIVLGADARATAGSIVYEKSCLKLHPLANNIYAAGAGTAADLHHVAEMIKTNLELLQRELGQREVRVEAARSMYQQHLFRHQGHVQCAMLIGGVDAHGTHLLSIAPHGSAHSGPFLTMGSGCLAAGTVLEDGYRDDMSREDAMALAARAIIAGIMHDCGSGQHVDLVVVQKKQRGVPAVAELIRRVAAPTGRTHMPTIAHPLGTTPILRSVTTKLPSYIVAEEDVVKMEA